MVGLALIWQTALALALCALHWMAALIVMRLVHQRRTARRAQDRKAVEQGLVDILRGADGERQLEPYVGRARLMAEVVLEFLALVRGEDRERVLAALRRMGVDAALRDRLGGGSVAGQLACIDALAVFPSVFTERALRKAAAEAGPRLRLAALRSLWISGSQVELDAILDAWTTGALTHTGLLGDFIRALVCADPQGGVRALQRTDLGVTMRTTLIEAVGEAGDYAALPPLIDLAAAPAAEIRAAALRSLGRLRHPAARGAIEAGIADQEWSVRLAACEAAGGVGLAVLREALAARLEDAVWRVRFQAAAALAALGPTGLDTLKDAADGPSGPAAAAAAVALAEAAA